MILTAHQPNFFPYEGVLDKIRAADLFVALNHVQFVRSQYQSRFNIGESWYTMSVDAGRDLIVNKRYVQCEYDWQKIKQRLPKHPLDQFDEDICESLADTNMYIIVRLMKLLGIKTQIAVDHPTDLTATDRIIELCKKFKATEYLSGPSGEHYLESYKFAKAGIRLRYFMPTGKRPAVEMIR